MAATIGANHQYPDGFVLYLGKMFAPVQDRHGPGEGFTHEVGDIVTVSSEKLGASPVASSVAAPRRPWTFGVADVMRNLAARKLI